MFNFLYKSVIFNINRVYKCIKVWFVVIQLILYEPAHDKTYNKTCATSKNADLHSLIRVFPDRMRLLQPPGYSKKDK